MPGTLSYCAKLNRVLTIHPGQELMRVAYVLEGWNDETAEAVGRERQGGLQLRHADCVAVSDLGNHQFEIIKRGLQS